MKRQTDWYAIKRNSVQSWGEAITAGYFGDKVKQESAKAAAIREVAEEGGVKAKIVNEDPFVVNYTYRFGEFLVKKTVYYYLMTYISGDVKDHDHEVSDATFEDEDEIKQLLSFESDKKAFDEILNKQHNS